MTTVTGQAGVDGARVAELLAQETEAFEAANPTSKVLNERACRRMVRGVPLHWMAQWPTPFPLYFGSAQGAHLVDVDLHEYADFCLGDTGAMFGHANPATVRAIGEQVARGSTALLPTEDAAWVGEELARRFGLPFWQMATSATDANRFAIRLARVITGRDRILVFNGNYHGSVDETQVTLQQGRMAHSPSVAPNAVDFERTTRLIEFNDIDSLERALAPGDVAAVLAEPAMTNVGVVLPAPAYHDALREITRRSGTLLIIDETHTISTGPGGFTKAHGLQPDLFVLGKAIAGGIPAAVYGMTDEVAAAVERYGVEGGHAGFGGTLVGNALTIHALRATLEEVMTDGAYDHMFALAAQFEDGVVAALRRAGLNWNVTRLGARVEYLFSDRAPVNGGDAKLGRNAQLEAAIHLYLLNRGILISPFHNMALMSPATSADDVDRHTRAFAQCVDTLRQH